MPRARSAAIIAMSLASLTSCTSIESLDLTEWQLQSGLQLTQNEAPADATPLRLVSAHRSGFYLLGLLPIFPAHFDHCVERIVEDAKSAGADGVANIRMRYEPASFFSLAEPVFPWMAKATVTGMAYRKLRR